MTAHENPAVNGDRLAGRLAELRISQAELARRIGVKQPSIAALISGKSQRTRHLHAIAKVLETSPDYLIGVTDETSASPLLTHEQSRNTAGDDYHPDLVNIHEIDLTMGMGLSFLDVPITERVRTFDRNWLRQYTHANPDLLFFCEGIGNSMEPYIHSHDLLLIDTSEKCVRMSDQIWAVTYGNCGSVKRLRPMADGSVKMMSDNPAVSDEFAYDGELSLIGRVVAIVRKI